MLDVVIGLGISRSPHIATGRHLNICILNGCCHPGKRSQHTQRCSCFYPYGRLIFHTRVQRVSQLCLYLLFDIRQMTPESLRYVLLQFVWTITCHCLIGQGEWLNDRNSSSLTFLSLFHLEPVSEIVVMYNIMCLS